MEKKSYRTPGRQRIGKFFAENPDRQFTTEEICVALNGDAEMGRSSIYRHLSELCSAEIIQKFHSAERNCHVYQYVGSECDCRNHFHGKCIQCGAIEHLGCHDSTQFVSHLMQEHGFEVFCGQSILYGLCEKCRSVNKGDHPNA